MVGTKYIPKPPQTSFAKVLESYKEKITKKYPRPQGQCKPHEAHFKPEQLEANVFCRILAAKPKMDAKTRLVLPSTLLSKVGLTADGTFGAVNAGKLRGHRFYIGAQSQDVPASIIHKIKAKSSEYARVPLQKDFGAKSRQLLVEEINRLAALYAPRSGSHTVCEVRRGEQNAIELHGSIPMFTIAADDVTSLPDTILYSAQGMRLAGSIYRYVVFNRGTNR